MPFFLIKHYKMLKEGICWGSIGKLLTVFLCLAIPSGMNVCHDGQGISEFMQETDMTQLKALGSSRFI